jgi:hypothetical protein
VTVSVFVEGGGRKPHIVASGSCDEAYGDFRRSLEVPDVFAILLVESEGPVPAGMTAEAYLGDREKHWTIAIPKQDVLRRLRDATRRTSKGTYEKREGFEIQWHIDPARVEQRSQRAADLLQVLRDKLT